MNHLSFDTDVAINRLKNLLMTKKEVKRGVFNSDLGLYSTYYINKISIGKNSEDTTYAETTSNIHLKIYYTKVKMNVLNIPEQSCNLLDLIILAPLQDNKFPKAFEVKIFGQWGKPSAVAIDKNDGNIYLIYLCDDDFILLQFAQMAATDRDFVLSDTNFAVTYEFGVDRKSLYAFIVREYGWENLRNNTFIRFNTSPFVRVVVGSLPTEAEKID